MEKIYVSMNVNDSGRYGKALEEAVKAALGLKVCVSRSGRTDSARVDFATSANPARVKLEM